MMNYDYELSNLHQYRLSKPVFFLLSLCYVFTAKSIVITSNLRVVPKFSALRSRERYTVIKCRRESITVRTPKRDANEVIAVTVFVHFSFKTTKAPVVRGKSKRERGQGVGFRFSTTHLGWRRGRRALGGMGTTVSTP
jgi:hypothetical protein